MPHQREEFGMAHWDPRYKTSLAVLATAFPWLAAEINNLACSK